MAKYKADEIILLKRKSVYGQKPRQYVEYRVIDDGTIRELDIAFTDEQNNQMMSDPGLAERIAIDLILEHENRNR